MTPKQLLLAAIRQEQLPALAAATYNLHPFGGFADEPAYRPILDAVLKAPNVGMICKTAAQISRPIDEFREMERETDNGGHRIITRLHTKQGMLRQVVRQPAGQPGYCTEHLLKTDEDVDKYLSLPHEPGEVDLTLAEEMYRRVGEHGLAYLAYDDPLLAVANLFDYEEFVLRCARASSSIKQLLDCHFQRSKAELSALLEQAEGREFLFYCGGPELATPPMLPPRLFGDLVTVYQTQLVDMIHQAGHLVSIHCHGKVRTVLDEFLEIGPDVLEPVEPPPQGDISLSEALDWVDGRICLMGYIQDQDLHTADPGEIAAEVREIKKAVTGRSGYIMTPTCTPFSHPPTDQYVSNYMEFVEAASPLNGRQVAGQQ